MTDDIDIFDEEIPMPSEEQLNLIAQLAQKYLAQEEKIEKLNNELQEEQKKMFDLSRYQIPDLMDEIGLKSFTLKSGQVVLVDDKIKASISEANKFLAFEWLRTNEHGGLIKNEVISSFGQGEDERALELREKLMKDGYEVKQKESVHGNALSAFVKDMIQNNGKIFTEEEKFLLGIFEFKLTKIK